MRKHLMLCFLVVATTSAHDDRLVEDVTGDDVRACQIDSPTIDECLIDSFEYIIPKLHNGFAAAHIPPLDPIQVDNVIVNLDQGALQMKGAVNIHITGFRNAKIKSLNTTITRESFDMRLVGYIPQIQADGSFRGRIRTNLATIDNKVAFNLTLTENIAIIRIKGNFVERDGERYLHVTRFILNPTKTEDLKIQLRGVFRDDQMNEWVSRFINDNWRGMYRQLIAVARGIWEPLLVDGANQMADHTDIPFRALMYFGDEEIYRIGE